MIGLWNLFLNIIALGVLAVIVRHPDMMQELENGYDDNSLDMGAPSLPTPLSKIDPPYAYRDHSLNYHNVDMGGLVCLCMIAISLMLIYGAAKGKPSHLLPFFCLQLFDFAITTLTAAGYLCYLRSVHRFIDESHRLPWREELLKLSPQALSIVVLLSFVSVVLLKAYIIGIVWRCYKYLTMRRDDLHSILPYIIPDATNRQERDYSTLLPDYDEAIAQAMKQPPPPYQVAMSTTVGSPTVGTTNAVNENQENNGREVPLHNSEPENSRPPPPYTVSASTPAVVVENAQPAAAAATQSAK